MFIFCSLHYAVSLSSLQQPMTPCLNQLSKRKKILFLQPKLRDHKNRYNVAGAAYDRGDVSEATRHYERVLFLSGDCSNFKSVLYCSSKHNFASRNVYRKYRRCRGCRQIQGQAKGYAAKEDFPNERCGQVEFKFVVFKDGQGRSSMQAVS